MAYADQMAGSRRFTTIAAVAAIHGVLGYAFISGMAANFGREVVAPFTVSNVPVEPPPPPDTPPPPEKALPRQSSVAPPVTTVTPVVPLPATDAPFVVVPLPPAPSLLSGTSSVAVDPPAPPVTVSKAVGVAARGNRFDWINTDDYPPSALRAGEQGVVAIALRIAGDGRIESCTVTASSGHAALDQATCRLYQRRGRFTPARDDAGTPVGATFNDRVRWQLPM